MENDDTYIDAKKNIAANLLEVPAFARVKKVMNLLRVLENSERSRITHSLNRGLAILEANKERGKQEFINLNLRSWSELRIKILREDLLQRLDGYPLVDELLLANDKLCQQQLLEEQKHIELRLEETHRAVKSDLQGIFRETFQLPELKKQTAAKLIAAFDAPDPAEVILAVLDAWDAEIKKMWEKTSSLAQAHAAAARAEFESERKEIP